MILTKRKKALPKAKAKIRLNPFYPFHPFCHHVAPRRRRKGAKRKTSCSLRRCGKPEFWHSQNQFFIFPNQI